MSKRFHTIYLSIIGILLVVVAILDGSPPKGDSDNQTIPRIAVFPFVSLTETDDLIADEITGRLINSLGTSGRVDLLSQTELQPTLRRAENHQMWAKNLSVSLILEGSVARAGDNIQITAQIVDGQTNKHVWFDTYDATTDSFEVALAKIENQMLSLASY